MTNELHPLDQSQSPLCIQSFVMLFLVIYKTGFSSRDDCTERICLDNGCTGYTCNYISPGHWLVDCKRNSWFELFSHWMDYRSGEPVCGYSNKCCRWHGTDHIKKGTLYTFFSTFSMTVIHVNFILLILEKYIALWLRWINVGGRQTFTIM